MRTTLTYEKFVHDNKEYLKTLHDKRYTFPTRAVRMPQ